MTDAALLSEARRVQLELEHFYDLEPGPDVADFVRPADDSAREALLLRHQADALEIALVVPARAGSSAGALDDAYLQLVEGVSHFVYVAERVRTGLQTTELELELQAEVDKFVLFAFDGPLLSSRRARAIRRVLYEQCAFVHSAESERGQRYRLANTLAAKLAHHLLDRPSRTARRFLQRFYRAGQGEKLRIAGR